MLDRLIALLLSTLLVLAPFPALASQGQLFSPTTGTVSGLALTNGYNYALDALNTANSGATPPTNQLSGAPSLGNSWLSTATTPYPLSVYDGAQYVTPLWIDNVNHLPIVQSGGGVATLAGAATTDLCSVPQFAVTVTGSASISSFGSTCPAGVQKVVTFAGSLTLVYNPTSLIVPGAGNISPTAVGDTAIMLSLGGGNWRIAAYTPSNGQPLVNPAIDVGAIELTFSPNIPSAKYMWSYGQALVRTSYPALYNALTISQAATMTAGSTVITGLSDTSQINWQSSFGANIEGSGIQGGASVVSCTSTTCTMSLPATASTLAVVTFFNYGNGNGATTFNLPKCDGNTLVGRNNMSGTPSNRLSTTYTYGQPNGLGALIGSQSNALLQANLPPVNFAVSGITLANGGFTGTFNLCVTSSCPPGGLGFVGAVNPNVTQGPNIIGNSLNSNVSITNQGSAASGGSSTPISTVQPGITLNCMIRVLASRSPSSPSLASLQRAMPLADRPRRAA